jgi:death-on-curing protein
MHDYLTVGEVVAIHHEMIEQFGGAHGVRDMGALESAVFRPQTGYYADAIAEAAALLESLAINHPFIDGNKRVAFGAADVFLRMNGFEITATPDAAYEFLIGLFEAGTFTFAKLEPWLRANVRQI